LITLLKRGNERGLVTLLSKTGKTEVRCRQTDLS